MSKNLVSVDYHAFTVMQKFHDSKSDRKNDKTFLSD